MKKVLLFCFCLCLLSGCSTIAVTGSYSVYVEKVDFLDFSKYVNNGFSINTLTNVHYPYENMGIIKITLREGLVRVDGKPIKLSYKEESAEYKDFKAAEKITKTATIYDGLDILVKECQKRGANGVIGLQYEYSPYGGVDISAIAIKK